MVTVNQVIASYSEMNLKAYLTIQKMKSNISISNNIRDKKYQETNTKPVFKFKFSDN